LNNLVKNRKQPVYDQPSAPPDPPPTEKPQPMTSNTHNKYNTGMKFQEIERIILKDGWSLKAVKGSHHQYVHPTKPGKVTIPYHTGDIVLVIIKSILKQAGL
jgi:predicted RNA binding protein YcfA (HicA-like mRNA interferase family)